MSSVVYLGMHVQVNSGLFTDAARIALLGRAWPPSPCVGEPAASHGWFNKGQALVAAVLSQDYARAHYLARQYYAGANAGLASA